MQVVNTKFVAHLKAPTLSSVVSRKHGIFSASSIRSLDVMDDLLDVWSKVSYNMRIIFHLYIHTPALAILFSVTLYIYFADLQQLMHWAY